MASISFNYGGKIIETRKKVQTIFESISTIGNFFNIILTICKVINSYYANKLLFVDIFRKLFYKEQKNINFKENIHLNIKSSNKLDYSANICFNNNNNDKKSLKSLKSLNNKFLTNDKNSIVEKNPKEINKIYRNFTDGKLMYYYLPYSSL